MKLIIAQFLILHYAFNSKAFEIICEAFLTLHHAALLNVYIQPYYELVPFMSDFIILNVDLFSSLYAFKYGVSFVF